jgi:hypothetical protein
MKPLRPLLKHYRILIACSTAPLHTIPVNDPIVTNLPNSNTSGNSGGGSGGSLGNQPKIDALIAMITSWIAEMKKPPTPTPHPFPLACSISCLRPAWSLCLPAYRLKRLTGGFTPELPYSERRFNPRTVSGSGLRILRHANNVRIVAGQDSPRLQLSCVAHVFKRPSSEGFLI